MKTTTLASSLFAASLSVLSLLALPTASHAQLQFVLQPSTQIGAPGSLLTYSGTLTNLGGSELFLNGDDFSLAGQSFLTLDDTPFFTNFPLSLLGGQSYSDALFTVALAPNTPGGNYVGSFSIKGGANDSTLNTLATQTFTVSVPSSAPEPASGLLLACGGGIAALGIVKRRRIAAK